MKSIRLQLLFTLLAAVVGAGLLIYRGPPPSELLDGALSDGHLDQVRCAVRWGLDLATAAREHQGVVLGGRVIVPGLVSGMGNSKHMDLHVSMMAIDLSSGNLLWGTTAQPGLLAADGDLVLTIEWGPADFDGTCLLRARSVADGRQVWEVPLAAGDRPIRLDASNGLILVMCPHLDPRLASQHLTWSYLVDRNGVVRLKLDEPAYSLARVNQDVVLVLLRRVVRMGLDGQIRWEVPLPEEWLRFSVASPVDFVPLEGGDLLIYSYCRISDSGVEVWRLDPAGGTVRWRVSCPGLGLGNSSALVSQDVTMTASGNRVTVFSEGSAGQFHEELSLETGARLRRY